ncbi:unnamed protein product [Caenorhabditis auriculariae]|uniref:G-protein coupled receptors family 1 profile domain-containing protein n=1 Tax=Caenorhabditis auriculariae TaxID=2777116 RepID=A0A8S1H242_9PELO|nr:unnamed protein product [Caenorhabditis auriculariae]
MSVLPQCHGFEDLCACLAELCPIVYNHSEAQKEECYMEHCFLSKRALDDKPLMQITFFYVLMFFVGFIGNVTTCVVIKRHPMLRTHASAYLTNLAVSDLVTLCVGLPFEVIMYWQQYPWPFPDIVCNLKALIAETTNSVSIMTVLFFAIERYIAVCHPFFHVKLKPGRQYVKVLILITWIVSIACAIPFAVHHRADYILKSWPSTNNNVPFLFHFSALIFFAFPLLTILVLYALISCKIATNRTAQREFELPDDLNMRINVVLSSIVIAFFICYLPFQLQRLLFFYLDNDTLMPFLNQYIYFISGFLFYLSPIVNPIVYNLASKRFRKATKEVFVRLRHSGKKHSAVSVYDTVHNNTSKSTAYSLSTNPSL